MLLFLTLKRLEFKQFLEFVYTEEKKKTFFFNIDFMTIFNSLVIFQTKLSISFIF